MPRMTSREGGLGVPNPEPMRESSGQTPKRPTMYVRPFSADTGMDETPFTEARPMPFSSHEDWDRFALNPNINGEQMRTLLDPVEHLERFTHSVDVSAYGGSKQAMIRSKTEEAMDSSGYRHGSGVYDWMSEGERQIDPITVLVEPGNEGYGQEEGHHRAVAGAAISEERGSPHLVKFQAEKSRYWGSRAGSHDYDYDEDDYDDWTPTPTPTPTPFSQQQTERQQTPANAQKLQPRTSRREAFSWNPAAHGAMKAFGSHGVIRRRLETGREHNA